MKIRTEADFLVSEWSGGTTSQLFIFPEEATLAARNFDWRISSAVIEIPESDFTLFEGYERILIPMEGKLEMEHQTPNGIIQQNVSEFELARFSGSWPTKGKGKLTDFNVIFKPVYHPKVQITRFSGNTELYSEETAVTILFCQSGSFVVNSQPVKAPAILVKEESEKLEITGSEDSRIISIEMNLTS
jgi:environmental stress-induced protein Ves